eukprot:m.150904 g.150904  ORF g.150904 m.150904 type:complete len:332 (+) comp9750_c0_seq3:1077-2072(+)
MAAEEQALRATAAQYQAAIERMLAEKADIAAQNAALSAEIKASENMLAPPKMLTTKELFEMSNPSLAELCASLLRKHRFIEERNRELLERIQSLQNQLIRQNETEAQIFQLRKAAAAQSAVQRSLEGQLIDAAMLKTACRRQERAIAELERLVADNATRRKPRDPLEPPIPSPAFVLLQEEVRTLTDTLDTAQLLDDDTLEGIRARIEQEKSRLTALQQASGQPSAGAIDDGVLAGSVAAAEKEAVELEAKLLQLVTAHAQELTDMEIRILEADAKMQGGFGAPSALALNELPSSAAFSPMRADPSRRPESGSRPAALPPIVLPSGHPSSR